MTLDTGRYFLIFASGKNRTNTSAPLHTNFKIEKSGGYLTLVNVVFVTSLRYRLPLEPFMIVFAMAALVRLARRWPAGHALLARFRLAGA